MAREHLEGRDNWQSEAGERGLTAEIEFSNYMTEYLRHTEFDTDDKPLDLKGIYGVNSKGKPHGILPEFAIHNTVSGKSIYVEVKRQRAAGNAHERACKYMMPGILSSARVIANQPDNVVPFWWVFSDGIANNVRYRREIMHWFKGMEQNVLLWQDMGSGLELEKHFEDNIRPMLL